MAEQSIKIKRRKWIILPIIIVIILLTRMYLNSPYTYVEERKIINYALKGSRDDFKLNSVYLDNENKVVTYEVYNKYKADIEKIGLIRLRMKEYLVENPDYFINDDYYIKLVWRDDISGHPWVLSFNNIWDRFQGKWTT